MDLALVMQALADRMDTITGLRVLGYPPDTAPQVPVAIVSYPQSYTYDETYGRGMDRLELPVVVLVGKVSDRATRDRIAKWVNGSGADSIKAVLESGTYTVFDSCRVTRVEFDTAVVGGVDLLTATLFVDIAGPGA